jgi:putative Mg2+ transporter-C (MgtC) family protein
VLRDSLTITFADDQAVWRLSIVAPDKTRAVPPAALAAELAAEQGVSRFSIVPVRS